MELTASTLLFFAIAAGNTASGEILVTGGADATGHNYTWRITNRSQESVVFISIPQYRADLFLPPTHWTQHIENPTGWFRSAGVAVAQAQQASGIAPGDTREFGLRIGPRGAPRGRGIIVVKTADQREWFLPAEVPVPPAWSEQYASLIGLGVIFIVFALWSQRKRSIAKGKP